MTDLKILYISVKMNIKNKTLNLKLVIYATSEFRNPNIKMYSMKKEYLLHLSVIKFVEFLKINFKRWL